MKAINFKRSIFAIFMIAVILLSAIPIRASAAEDIITNDENGIPDNTLYNYILSISDSNNDGIIQRSETEDIRYLLCGYNSDFGGEKIATLKGLNNLQNLVIIEVDYNALTSLEGIEGLNLWEIRASNNELVDISAVKGMDASLYYLDVQCNNLSKLPNMTGFSKLKTAAMYIGTDFMYNKLTYNELYYNLPSQLTDLEYVGDTPWVEFQSRYQSPDPIPDPADIKLNANGVFVEGLIIPDAILQVNQVSVDLEDAVVAYDINLIRDHEKIQPDSEITISIPSEYSDCDVFWVKDDGTKVNMNAEYADGKYIFTTDHLSVYALVRKSATLLGDVNGDGKIGIDDATDIQKYIVGIYDFSDYQKRLSDVDKNGKIGVDDVTLIQKHMAGLAVIE